MKVKTIHITGLYYLLIDEEGDIVTDDYVFNIKHNNVYKALLPHVDENDFKIIAHLPLNGKFLDGIPVLPNIPAIENIESEYMKSIIKSHETLVELSKEMAKAIKQTFKQYNGTTKDEYAVSFLYPANNKAFQMLNESLKKYEELQKIPKGWVFDPEFEEYVNITNGMEDIRQVGNSYTDINTIAGPDGRELVIGKWHHKA